MLQATLNASGCEGEVERENEVLKMKLERMTAVPDPNSLVALQASWKRARWRLLDLGEVERAKQQIGAVKQAAEAKEKC